MAKRERAARDLKRVLEAQGKEGFYVLLTHNHWGVSEVVKLYAKDAYEAFTAALDIYGGDYAVTLIGEGADDSQ